MESVSWFGFKICRKKLNAGVEVEKKEFEYSSTSLHMLGAVFHEKNS